MRAEMKTTTLILIAGALGVIAAILLLISGWGSERRMAAITSFEECAAAGNPIMESYPEQCRTADGRMFVNSKQQVTLPGPADAPPNTSNSATSGCVIGGCSGQLCTDAKDGPAMSTCEYRAEYGCYKSAKCERQADGKCGWTQTPALRQCIQNAQSQPSAPTVY